ncbi:4'-phosphopantetheinyl transferase [Rathayibacter iranicus NCPPB 2253 = VKM Ac-1602]|nr:4'-phosphopantetheinyl transferase [Rathayibacter iranicus NCPPB 2253 = VKM Ac-1602]
MATAIDFRAEALVKSGFEVDMGMRDGTNREHLLPAHEVLLATRVPLLWDHTDLLSVQELERSERFACEDDRARFQTGAALVRLMSSSVSGIPPAQLIVDRTCPDCGQPHGRPRLPMDLGLSLSVTHGGRWVAVACSRSLVGVDVEPIDPRILALETRIVSEREAGDLIGLTEPQKVRALTRAWARKEAATKSLGVGLRVPMPELEVLDSSPPHVMGSFVPRGTRISLVDFTLDPVHCASIAIVHSDRISASRILIRRFPKR